MAQAIEAIIRRLRLCRESVGQRYAHYVGTAAFPMNLPTPLVVAFLSRRAELKRYFAVRVGDADAEDLVQETYLRVAALDADMEVRNSGGYLYRLGTNIMVDRLRQQRAMKLRDHDWQAVTASESASGELLHDTVPVDRVLIARDRVSRLSAALDALPVAVQRSFRLHKFEGLSHAEVAARLGISRSLVEKHMMRALKHLLRVPE